MKPLSSYISTITESLDEYYHFTNYGNMINIIKDDFLAGSREVCDNDYTKPRFISLTRSKNAGTGYPHGLIDDKVIRIVLDGKKLASKYKIAPYDYFGSRDGVGSKATVMKTSWREPRQFDLSDDYIRRNPDVEAEDRIFLKPGVDGIKGISKYIKEIQIKDGDFSVSECIRLNGMCRRRGVNVVMLSPSEFELGKHIKSREHITEQTIDTSGTINIFIGCSKSKEDKTDKAEDLYTGSLFKKSLAIAEAFKNAKVYILSGKHGLVRLDDRLRPYDDYIGDKSEEENESWAKGVIDQMKHAHINFDDKTYFFCGEDYYKNIIDHFADAETVFEKGLGYSLKKLDSLMKKYNIPDPE